LYRVHDVNVNYSERRILYCPGCQAQGWGAHG